MLPASCMQSEVCLNSLSKYQAR